MSSDHTDTGKNSAFENAPGGLNITLRRIAAILIAMNLYSIDYPFTPVSWFTKLEAGRLLDQMFGTALIMGASILQWHIASIRYPLPLNWSLGAATQPPVYLRGLRLDDEEVTMIWKPQYYWIWAAVEALLLGVAWASSHTLLTRCVVVAITSASWIVGLPATPPAFRREVRVRLKDIWERVLATEFYNNSNRRGQYRWL